MAASQASKPQAHNANTPAPKPGSQLKKKNVDAPGIFSSPPSTSSAPLSYRNVAAKPPHPPPQKARPVPTTSKAPGKPALCGPPGDPRSMRASDGSLKSADSIRIVPVKPNKFQASQPKKPTSPQQAPALRPSDRSLNMSDFIRIVPLKTKKTRQTHNLTSAP